MPWKIICTHNHPVMDNNPPEPPRINSRHLEVRKNQYQSSKTLQECAVGIRQPP